MERPAGCELLGFEGEIALVIGKPARRVGLEDAWSHVEWVTASNDLGVYDLRYADKGSNLRSKGGDGFTPVGPGLIAADAVDPATLRIRTWHNGELVQDDTTGDLLFPFARLVADLSQLLTLEDGRHHPHRHPRRGLGGQAGRRRRGGSRRAERRGARPAGRLATTVAEGTTPFARLRRPAQDRRPPAGGSVRLARSRRAGRRPAAAHVLTPELKAQAASPSAPPPCPPSCASAA